MRFCGLCEPIYNFTTDFIDDCNVTGLWRSYKYKADDEMKCKFLPQIFYYYPFKNFYCMRCNGIGCSHTSTRTSPYTVEPYHRIPGVNWFSITRNLFSVSQTERTSQYMYDEHHCENDQIYNYIDVSITTMYYFVYPYGLCSFASS